MPTIMDLYPNMIDVVGLADYVPRTSCWRWRGAIDSYGQARHEGRRIGAHRLSLSLKLGVHHSAMGEMACHTCDNKWCVNPEHLFPGGAAENNADKLKWQLSLSLDDISEIRNSDLPSHVLARRWHLSKRLIDQIRPGYRVATKHLVERKLNNSPRYTRMP